MKPLEGDLTAETREEKTTMTTISTCIVCWEPTANKVNTTLSCNHGACASCIKSWIERCEQDGQDEATCPHCRRTIDPETIVAVLGRPYQRVSKTAATIDDDGIGPVDDLTQTWFEENNAHQCPNCGMWTTRDEYDDPEDSDNDNDDDENMDATACVCGYVYCWKCNQSALDCGCDQEEFWDHLTQMTLRMEDAKYYPVAGPEHFEDLTDFMEERRDAIYNFDRNEIENNSNNNNNDNSTDNQAAAETTTTATESQEQPQEEEVVVVEEPAEAYLIALFNEYTEEAGNYSVTALFDDCRYAEEDSEAEQPQQLVLADAAFTPVLELTNGGELTVR